MYLSGLVSVFFRSLTLVSRCGFSVNEASVENGGPSRQIPFLIEEPVRSAKISDDVLMDLQTRIGWQL